MLLQADQNSDGQLSYSEWFEWLNPRSDSSSNHERVSYSSDSPGLSGYLSFHLSHVQLYVLRSPDPMVSALEEVLLHSVSTLRIAVRLSDDPTLVSAAFVAGGLRAGILSLSELGPQQWQRGGSSVTRNLLAQLSPATRLGCVRLG